MKDLQKMICPKCGKTYTDDIHFCTEDGTTLVEDDIAAENKSENAPHKDAIDGINKKITGAVDGMLDKAKDFSNKNKWNGFVLFWSILSLVINAIMFLKEIIRMYSYIAYLGRYNWLAIVLLSVNILAIIFLLNRKKSGFYLLCGSVMINIICSIVFSNTMSFWGGLISVAVWYVILQIKYSDPSTGEQISAWETLQ